MKIYNVIVEDRHCDVIVRSYVNVGDAVEDAHNTANTYCTYPEDKTINDYEGYVLHITYSCEGDSVCVVETELKS